MSQQDQLNAMYNTGQHDFFFWVSWLLLSQFGYGNYESAVAFFYHVRSFHKMRFKFKHYTIIVSFFCRA